MDQATLGRMQQLLPVAQKWSTKTGIPVEVFLAINNFESNFGNNPQWGALFGMTGSGTAGKVTLQTSAGPLTFAAYNSPDEAYEHFVRVVSTSPNYATAWQNRANPAAFFAGLQAGGYAGDHNDEDRGWSKNITATIDSTIRPAMKQAGVSAPAPAAAPSTATQDPAKTDAFGAVVALGHNEIGKRYAGPIVGESDAMRWGNPGWDCSSFVSGVYKQLGVSLTPYTDTAYGETRAINQQDARPGDVIFYRGGSQAQPGIAYHHMGIYLGGGKVMSALYSGGVQVHDIAAPDGIGKGWEIRRAPGIETAQVPQAAQQAIATGQQIAQRQGTAMTTPTGQQPKRDIDPQAQETNKAMLATIDEQILALYADSKANPENAYRNSLTLTQLFQQRTQAATLAYPEQYRDPGVAQQSQASLINANANMAGVPIAQQNADTATQQAQTAAVTAMYNIGHTIFGDKLGAQNLILGVLNHNMTAQDAWVKNQLAKGTLDLGQAVQVYEATLKQQAQNLLRAGEVLNRAKFIRDGRMENAARLLPAGTEYQPGFAPTDPLNQVFAKFGIAPMVIRANPIDPRSVDPEKALFDADTSTGMPAPMDATGEIAAIRNVKPVDVGPQPAPLGITGMDNPQITMPGLPTKDDYDRYLGQITGASGGSTRPTPPATPPATDPTVVQAPPPAPPAPTPWSPEDVNKTERIAPGQQDTPPAATPSTYLRPRKVPKDPDQTAHPMNPADPSTYDIIYETVPFTMAEWQRANPPDHDQPESQRQGRVAATTGIDRRPADLPPAPPPGRPRDQIVQDAYSRNAGARPQSVTMPDPDYPDQEWEYEPGSGKWTRRPKQNQFIGPSA